MKVNKKFSIEKDAHNYIVVKRKKIKRNKKEKKEGKRKYSESKTYHPSLFIACKNIQKQSVDVESLETIISSLEKATSDLKKALEKIDKSLLI